MLFVIIGVIVVVLHLAGIGPMAAWSWKISDDLWKFVLPFLLAIVWWAWADWSGYNKRREMERMENRKRDRRARNLENLGLDLRSRRGKRPGKGT
jgi:small Trp-rich protein